MDHSEFVYDGYPNEKKKIGRVIEHRTYYNVRGMSDIVIESYIVKKEDGSIIVFNVTQPLDDSQRLSLTVSSNKLTGNCRTCNEREQKFSTLINRDGTHPFLSFDPDSGPAREMKSVVDAPRKGSYGISIIDNEDVFDFRLETGTYTHFHLSADVLTTPEIDKQLYEAAHHCYVEEKLIMRLLVRLCSNGLDGAHISLTLMEEIMHTVTYGTKFLGSIRWLLKVVNYLRETGQTPTQMSKFDSFMLSTKALFWAPIAIGPVCTFYHQANDNILGLLEDAKTEKAMRRMVEKRLNPNDYQRPTSKPSDGDIENAMKILGDFTNSLMTTDEVEALPHTVKINGKPQLISSMAAFAAMKKTKKSGPGGFAARVGKDTESIVIDNIVTLTDLVLYFRENPDTDLEVQTTTLKPIYIALTSLLDVCRYPHLWAFMNKRSSTYIGLGGWKSVSAMVPIYEYAPNHQNFMFICKGAHPGKKMTNCCFPEFLAMEHRRTCRKAFEELNKTMPLVIPTNGPYALGVGTSGKSENGKLTMSVILKINGIKKTFTKLF